MRQRYGTFLLLLSFPLAARAVQQTTPPPAFTVDQILGFPSPENLVASPVGSTIAWTFNERGVRNIYVADAPGFEPRRLTAYREDDGQELTQLSFSGDGTTIVYVRGGDHGSNRQADAAPNPAGSPIQPKIQIWSIRVSGGAPKLSIGEGDNPVMAPDSQRVAFVRNRQIWFAPLDGSKPAEQAFYARGTSQSPVWSPDGRTLAFVSSRNDHSFIGLFTAGQPIRFVAPSTARDSLPAWSPDGKKIAFLRQPGAGGAPRPPLARRSLCRGRFWSPMWPRSVATGPAMCRSRQPPAAARRSIRFCRTPAASAGDGPPAIPWSTSRIATAFRTSLFHSTSLHRQQADAADARLVHGRTGGADARPALRHLQREYGSGSERPRSPPSLQGAGEWRHAPVNMTSGTGIEWSPAVTADGQTVAFLRSDAQRPPAPAVVPVSGGNPRAIGAEPVAGGFPGGPPRHADAGFVPCRATALKSTDNCSSPPPRRTTPPPGNRRLCTSTEAGRDRCCSAGTIDGSTRMITAPISISPAAASSCCRWITG